MFFNKYIDLIKIEEILYWWTKYQTYPNIENVLLSQHVTCQTEIERTASPTQRKWSSMIGHAIFSSCVLIGRRSDYPLERESASMDHPPSVKVIFVQTLCTLLPRATVNLRYNESIEGFFSKEIRCLKWNLFHSTRSEKICYNFIGILRHFKRRIPVP